MLKTALIAFLFLSALAPGASQAVTGTDTHMLTVPFVVQAPLGNWSWPWQDFCEEASVIMAYSYVTGRSPDRITSALEMLRLAIFELKTFGYEKDTGLVETDRMIREYYKYEKTRIVERPSIDFIKAEIQKGNLVIAPVAGQLLKNPYFVPPGPRYHMVVIRGFSGSSFIVNEPGTRNGEAFRYPMATVMGALHDFVPLPEEITKGRKAVLIVEK